MKAITILGLILLFILEVNGQSKKLRIANNYFSNGEYKLAESYYKKSITKRNSLFYFDIYFNLGECERILNDTIVEDYYWHCIYNSKRSVPYSRAFEFNLKRYKKIVVSCYYIEEYEQAFLWFERIKKIEPLDSGLSKMYEKSKLKVDSIMASRDGNLFFKKRLGIEITEDVKDINYVEFFIYQYQMSFYCSQKTMLKIVKKLNLEMDSLNTSINIFANEYSWWQYSDFDSVKYIYRTKIYPNRHRGQTIHYQI